MCVFVDDDTQYFSGSRPNVRAAELWDSFTVVRSAVQYY